jgi:ureidoacrylate peracid hydrolase
MVATSRTISIRARPASISMDLSKTAVLVVDMQNDFGAKGGMFDRAGVNLSVIEQAVAPTARVIEGARIVGIPIIYIRTAHRSDLSDIGREGSPYWQMCQRMKVGSEMTAPTGEPSRILIEGTWNTEMLPELAPLANDVVVTKTRFSGFYETVLDKQLRELNIHSLIVVGCTTSICVEATIRDAVSRDYICVLPADCTGQPQRRGLVGAHEATLGIIETSLGWISSSDNILDAIK